MDIVNYKNELHERELSDNTISMYLKTVNDFLDYAGEQEISQSLFINYKKNLLERYKTNSVNTKITILNNFFKFEGVDIKVKQEKIQKSISLDNILSETDYKRLVRVAGNRGEDRTRAVMISLYYTGIRISELESLTVEALKKGSLDINHKGKHRRVPINKTLSKELKCYIKDHQIEQGVIFCNSKGKALSRSHLFKEIKYIGGQARVKKDKVYPHSFRHLFAKQWLKHNNNNVLALADLLGHSNLETTRIYTTLSTDEQRDTIKF